jgi:hypothetical protein
MGHPLCLSKDRKEGKQEKPIKYKDWIMYRCKFGGSKKIQSLNGPIFSYCCSLFANCIVARGQETLFGWVVGHGARIKM